MSDATSPEAETVSNSEAAGGCFVSIAGAMKKHPVFTIFLGAIALCYGTYLGTWQIRDWLDSRFNELGKQITQSEKTLRGEITSSEKTLQKKIEETENRSKDDYNGLKGILGKRLDKLEEKTDAIRGQLENQEKTNLERYYGLCTAFERRIDSLERTLGSAIRHVARQTNSYDDKLEEILNRKYTTVYLLSIEGATVKSTLQESQNPDTLYDGLKKEALIYPHAAMLLSPQNRSQLILRNLRAKNWWGRLQPGQRVLLTEKVMEGARYEGDIIILPPGSKENK